MLQYMEETLGGVNWALFFSEKKKENNGTDEIGLVPPTPDLHRLIQPVMKT